VADLTVINGHQLLLSRFVFCDDNLLIDIADHLMRFPAVTTFADDAVPSFADYTVSGDRFALSQTDDAAMIRCQSFSYLSHFEESCEKQRAKDGFKSSMR